MGVNGAGRGADVELDRIKGSGGLYIDFLILKISGVT